MSSDRVYRFEDVIGNFSTVSVIKSSVRNGSFPNFTIMSGDSGTGKSTCAEIVSLALNCENPIDSSPCLRCNSCRVNLASLQGKGNSTRVKKVNLSDSEVKKEMSNIINQIFKLDVGSGKSVFILEEAHSLLAHEQTALLEEIDKLNDNVYVILCTTRPKSLLEELRNRSITFRFSKLKSSECKVLLEKILSKSHIDLPNNVKDEILKYSKGVPRRIVKLVDFITKNNCDYNTIIDFLGLINPKVFHMLLKSTNDVLSYSNYLNELITDYSIDDLVYNLKKYLSDLHFLASGVSTFYSNTTKQDKDLAFEIGKTTLYKIQNLVYTSTINEDCDFVFCMLKVRSLIEQSKIDSKNSSKILNQVPSQSIGQSTGLNCSVNGVNSISGNPNNVNSANNSLRSSSIYTSPQEMALKSERKAILVSSHNVGSSLTPLNLSKLKESNE